MLDPAPFFAAGYFGTKGVSLAHPQKYTVDVIVRLTEDNPGGVFTSLIQARLPTTPTPGQCQTEAQKMWGALANS